MTKKSAFSSKVLELVSKEISGYFVGTEIVKILTEFGMNREVIQYPNTKWVTINEAFKYIQNNTDEPDRSIFRLLRDFLHPLNHDLDKARIDKLAKKVAGFLEYDNILVEEVEGHYFVAYKDEIDEVEDYFAQKEAEDEAPDVNKSNYSERVIELVAKEFKRALDSVEIRKAIEPILGKNPFTSKNKAILNYMDDWLEEKDYDILDILQDIRKKDQNADRTISDLIEALLHPLNYDLDENRIARIVDKIKKYLDYDDFFIEHTEKAFLVLSKQDMAKRPAPKQPNEKTVEDNIVAQPEKTSTDYIIEAINYFKEEYNKVRLPGLVYEYDLGTNISKSNYEPEPDEINHAFFRGKAIEQLHEIGIVKKYSIENRVMDDYGNVNDYAICKIDEIKLTQKEAPRATNAGVEALTQKIIHEHKHNHFFENSIQEKGIDLNHKYEKTPGGFYITKKEDDFYYKGRNLGLSKTSIYYKLFCILFAELPDGGEIKYKDLISKVRGSMSKTKNMSDDEVVVFIQNNLTGKKNGFLRRAGIADTEDNGKPLIKVEREVGIVFNNKTG